MAETRNNRLTNEEIDAELRRMNGWSYDVSVIVKTYVRKNFMDAVNFIQAIAPLAEARDHHPDLLLSSYKNVKVMLSTHSAGGITHNDFDLARAIDELP